MNIREGFDGSVGNTPLIKLRSISEETGCTILGKAEFMNPGGSVKDRAALFIIDDAEKSGKLKPGGVVVEGTAGNTGIGLTHICNARGYKSMIVIPDNQSIEKIETLRTLGADVKTVPPAPFANENNYVHVSRRLAESLPNAIWANQFDNTSNRRAHFETTGKEIWQQTDGKLDAFTCATGTGGTFAGVAEYLKQQNKSIRTIVADPMGSGVYSWVKNGEFKSQGNSFSEGIGIMRLTRNLEGAPIDDAVQVDDSEMINILYKLLRKDGIFLGGSAGINVAAAVKVAQQLGPGHTIVTILCDGGARYQSKLFNSDWQKEKGLTPDLVD
ncbi:MAG: cysteine synthase A [Leptospiraceae bacterium]|nr:cysteine synthase A [Leptospiraceae bacterium]